MAIAALVGGLVLAIAMTIALLSNSNKGRVGVFGTGARRRPPPQTWAEVCEQLELRPKPNQKLWGIGPDFELHAVFDTKGGAMDTRYRILGFPDAGFTLRWGMGAKPAKRTIGGGWYDLDSRLELTGDQGRYLAVQSARTRDILARLVAQHRAGSFEPGRFAIRMNGTLPPVEEAVELARTWSSAPPSGDPAPAILEGLRRDPLASARVERLRWLETHRQGTPLFEEAKTLASADPAPEVSTWPSERPLSDALSKALTTDPFKPGPTDEAVAQLAALGRERVVGLLHSVVETYPEHLNLPRAARAVGVLRSWGALPSPAALEPLTRDAPAWRNQFDGVRALEALDVIANLGAHDDLTALKVHKATLRMNDLYKGKGVKRLKAARKKLKQRLRGS